MISNYFISKEVATLPLPDEHLTRLLVAEHAGRLHAARRGAMEQLAAALDAYPRHAENDRTDECFAGLRDDRELRSLAA